jgi:hypothetical protein
LEPGSRIGLVLSHRGREQAVPAVVRHDRDAEGFSIEFLPMNIEQERWLVATTFARADIWISQWGRHGRETFFKSLGEVLHASARLPASRAVHHRQRAAGVPPRHHGRGGAGLMNQRIPRGMARLRGVRLLGLLAGLTCAIGLGQAQTTPRTATTALPAPLSQAADSGVRDKVTTLEQLGIDYAITLRGVQGTVGIPFSVRTDEMVQKITLHLRYSYSPALLPDLSHIKVTVNDVTVATLPVPTENAGKLVQSDIEIDPRWPPTTTASTCS